MTLALIAGQGGLPPHLVRSLLARGEVPVICEMEQFPSDIAEDLPRVMFRLETLGTFLTMLGEIGVTRLCMTGAMRRPQIDPGKIDAATAPLMGPLQEALAKGDDGTLRAFIDLFETRGIKVIGAAEIAPDLLPAVGVLTRTRPWVLDAELQTARAVLDDMGRADLGQAVVVRGSDVISREDDRGTDAMLKDLLPEPHVPWPKNVGGGDPGTALNAGLAIAEAMCPKKSEASDEAVLIAFGGILFKAPKPGQDLRADMPVIGVETARNAARAGLAGIVIEAGGVMVLDRPAVVEALDTAEMFLSVVAP